MTLVPSDPMSDSQPAPGADLEAAVHTLLAEIGEDPSRANRRALNKERGHATGDVVLAAFGGILATRLRRADVVARSLQQSSGHDHS